MVTGFAPVLSAMLDDLDSEELPCASAWCGIQMRPRTQNTATIKAATLPFVWRIMVSLGVVALVSFFLPLAALARMAGEVLELIGCVLGCLVR